MAHQSRNLMLDLGERATGIFDLSAARVRRRKVVRGLIKEYEQAA